MTIVIPMQPTMTESTGRLEFSSSSAKSGRITNCIATCSTTTGARYVANETKSAARFTSRVLVSSCDSMESHWPSIAARHITIADVNE